VLRKIYAHTGLPYPGDHIFKAIDSTSVGLGRQVQLATEIDQLCEDLLRDLNRCYERQTSRESEGATVAARP
jgi:hypothetical protein